MPEEVSSRESPAKPFHEEMLIQRIRNGEHELFYELIQPYERRVYAAGILLAGSFEVARSSVFGGPALRSEHAQPGRGVPPDMLVVVSTDGKTFHVPGCRFIHDKAHIQTIQAREAMREGYAPCVRCMKEYLTG